MKPLPLALAALLLVLTWQTEAFQAWAFPESYRDTHVKALVDSIAFQRAQIRDSRDELTSLSAVTAPEEAVVYLTLRHGIEEDIHAAEDMIRDYEAQLSKLRGYH